MAIREKTITYAFPMTTATVVDATVTNLTGITIEIPEASPTFVSVMAELGGQDIITATGGTIGEYRIAVRLGAAGYTTITETDDIANSGENLAVVIGPFDFTSHFTTNWTGTSMTCDSQVYFDQTTGTTLGMVNVTVILHITYTYDDTAATQAKTVRIPLESLVGALPTAAANFGTSQIPQLTSGGILPENSPVILDWFILIEGNEGTTAATDFTISANIDGGATTTFGNQESALASARFCRWIYKPTAPDPTTSHNLQLWSSLAARMNHCSVTLVVTYKFTLSGTTRTLVSVELPIEMPSPLGANAAGDASRFARTYTVAEPGTITMRQSAFQVSWNTTGNLGTPRFRAGAQAYRAYTASAAGNYCGQGGVLQQRIDSGGAQGVGIASFGAGENDVVIDGYGSTLTVDATNLNGVIILNYECDVPTQGIGAAAHTVRKLIRQFDALLADLVEVNSVSFAITPANYWLADAGLVLFYDSLNAANAINIDMQLQAGEGDGAGYAALYKDALQSNPEAGSSIIYVRARDAFRRCPEDADADRMNIETARTVRIYHPATVRTGLMWLVTLHHVTYTVADSISGNNASLPTTVRLHRASDDQVLQEKVLSAGTTAFSFTVYDQRDYYVSAYQDDTHVGRSGVAVPA